MARYTFTELEDLWKRNGGNPLYAAMAAAIALAESGGNPTAINHNSNGSTDRGLWQINSVHGSLSTTDVNRNAKAAIEISNNGTNWRPWCTAWSDGKCGGTFLGKGAPVWGHLPSGANTGTTSTGQSGSTQEAPALKAIAAAYSQLGLPYKFGAEAPSKDFDCSGLTQWAYSKAGITLPRTAAAQQAATNRISKAELRPGDLVFWGNPAHHVALYIGGGYVIQAPQTGEKIDRVKVWGSPSNYGRVKGSGAQGVSGDMVANSTTETVAFGGSLNPMNWPGELYDTVVRPIGYAVLIGLGGTLMVMGLIVLVLSSRTVQAGISMAATRGAVTPPTKPQAPRAPAPPPEPRPVVRAETVEPVPRARRRPAIESRNPRVIEGRTV